MVHISGYIKPNDPDPISANNGTWFLKREILIGYFNCGLGQFAQLHQNRFIITVSVEVYHLSQCSFYHPYFL